MDKRAVAMPITTADDTAAAAILANATAQLTKANAIATTVELLAAGAAPAPAGAVFEAHPADAAPTTAIALVGVMDVSNFDLLSM